MARATASQGNWLGAERPASATHTVEKTPQFRASMERFAERAGERLSGLLGALFTAATEPTRNANTFAGLSEHVGQPASLIRSESLDSTFAILFESGVAPLLVDAMFGVEFANDAAPPETPRPATALEIRMIGDVAQALAGAYCDAFAPVGDFDLAVESTEMIEDDMLLGAKDFPALLAPVTIKAPTGAFTITLLTPHPFLTTLQGAFARGPAPGAAKLDPVWSNRMERRVTESNLTLTAILDEFQMSLADVSSLRLGHVLPLSDDGQGRVRIECGERGVFICSLGERNGRYALEVEDVIAKPVEGAYPPTAPSF